MIDRGFTPPSQSPPDLQSTKVHTEPDRSPFLLVRDTNNDVPPTVIPLHPDFAREEIRSGADEIIKYQKTIHSRNRGIDPLSDFRPPGLVNFKKRKQTKEKMPDVFFLCLEMEI